MRLALSLTDPAFLCSQACTVCRIERSRRGIVLASATNTSPFGKTLEPARVIEVGGVSGHAEAFRCDRVAFQLAMVAPARS